MYQQELIDLVNQWSGKQVWTGTIDERKQKFIWMHERLQRLFDKPEIKLVFGSITKETEKRQGSSGASKALPSHIIISNKLSVVTFLHEWAHVLGMNETQAIEWSQGLFKIGFPTKYRETKKFPEAGLLLKLKPKVKTRKSFWSLFTKKDVQKAICVLGLVSAIGLMVVIISVYVEAGLNGGRVIIAINDFGEMLWELILVVPIMVGSIIYLCYKAVRNVS